MVAWVVVVVVVVVAMLLHLRAPIPAPIRRRHLTPVVPLAQPLRNGWLSGRILKLVSKIYSPFPED